PDDEQRAITAGTVNAGAEFVPQGFNSTFHEKLNSYGGVRPDGSEVITSASGNPWVYATFDDTSNTGELTSEASDVTEDVDPTTDKLTLGGYMFDSKVVKVSFQQLADGAFPIDTWLGKALATRVARIQNTKFTLGTGGG